VDGVRGLGGSRSSYAIVGGGVGVRGGGSRDWGVGLRRYRWFGGGWNERMSMVCNWVGLLEGGIASGHTQGTWVVGKVIEEGVGAGLLSGGGRGVVQRD